MFGFFNSKKRISDEISNAISNTLRACLQGKNFINNDKTLNVPKEFWNDEYICGFIICLSSLFIKLQFNGDSFSTLKSGEILNLILMKVCGEFWEDVLSVGNSNMKHESSLYKKGGDEAVYIYHVINGTLKSDSSTSIIKQAKLLSQKRQKAYLENAKLINGNVKNTNQFNLGLAVIELTILKYIHENYFEDKERFNQSDLVNNDILKIVEKYLNKMGYDLLPYGAEVALMELESGYSPAEAASHIALTTMALDFKQAEDNFDKLITLTAHSMEILKILKILKDTGQMHPAQWKNDTNALWQVAQIDKDQIDWVNKILDDPISGKERLANSKVML